MSPPPSCAPGPAQGSLLPAPGHRRGFALRPSTATHWANATPSPCLGFLPVRWGESCHLSGSVQVL